MLGDSHDAVTWESAQGSSRFCLLAVAVYDGEVRSRSVVFENEVFVNPHQIHSQMSRRGNAIVPFAENKRQGAHRVDA